MSEEVKGVLVAVGTMLFIIVMIFSLPVLDYAWEHWNCYWQTKHCAVQP